MKSFVVATLKDDVVDVYADYATTHHTLPRLLRNAEHVASLGFSCEGSRTQIGDTMKLLSAACVRLTRAFAESFVRHKNRINPELAWMRVSRKRRGRNKWILRK